LIRKCGYGEIQTKTVSYARRLGALIYPRFHCYLDVIPNGFQVNIHLDQKQASYTGHTAHSGEYDGEVVEREGERIRLIIETFWIGDVLVKDDQSPKKPRVDLSQFG